MTDEEVDRKIELAPEAFHRFGTLPLAGARG